jgi:hypothetical protein
MIVERAAIAALLAACAVLAPQQPARPAQATPAAPPAARTPAAPAAQAVPPLIVDCATSARSAQVLRDRRVPMYTIIYQACDPEAGKTGRIDLDKLAAEVERKMGQQPSGWAMLDYEAPFDEWLQKGVGDQRCEQARSEIIKALRFVRARWPKVKWTIYGHPFLLYWLPNGTAWDQAPEQVKRAEIEKRVAVYGPILAEVDWVNPSNYDINENALQTSIERARDKAHEQVWRTQHIELAKETMRRAGIPPKPILPAVNLFFPGEGRATYMRPIPVPELQQDQIAPQLAAGVDGFAVWTGVDYIQGLVTGNAKLDGDPESLKTRTRTRSTWVGSYLDGRTPADWSSDDVKFVISQRTGQTIADGVEAILAAWKARPGATSPAR